MKIVFAGILFVASGLVLISGKPALAGAEVTVPVKVRITRCVSFEERLEACRQRNLCCELLEEEVAGEKEPEAQSPEQNVASYYEKLLKRKIKE